MIEEQSSYDELFTEQQFQEEPSKEYYDQYSVRFFFIMFNLLS